MKALLYTFLCLLVIHTSTAQSINTIKGNVINSQKEMMFGNAILLSETDSSILTGVSFLEGNFVIDNLNLKKVLLKLTSLEFQDQYIPLTYQGKAIVDLGDITVNHSVNELAEFTVAAKKPLVVEKADGSVEVLVANTSLATSTTANEILRRSPGIIFDEENGVSVFGKGAAIIYLNGVRIDNDRLSTISPSEIDKIEIINNPGPKYDAEGNVVINIVSRRSTAEGSLGSIKNYYSMNSFSGSDNRTNLNYSYVKNNWSLNGNYGLQVGNDRHILRTSRTRELPEDFFSSVLKTDWQYKYNNFSNASLGAQYNFKKHQYLSLEYSGAFEDLGGNQLSINNITDAESGLYQSQVAMNDLTKKNTFNANYHTQTDTLGSNLFIGSQYSSFSGNFDNDIGQTTTINSRETNSLLNNKGTNDISIFSNQLDYSRVLKNNLTLETGVKYWLVNIVAETAFFNTTEENATLTSFNNFKYTEKVGAAYLNLVKKLSSKVNINAGIRTETTRFQLTSNTSTETVINRNYVNLFPAASINAILSDKLTGYFSFSSRINRPSYEQLNPFVIYQDEFTSIEGNTDIVPTKVNAFELGGTLEGWGLKMGYTYNVDPMYGGAFQSEENPRGYILRRYNMSEEHRYFTSISKSINTKWWSSTNNASISYSQLIDQNGLFNVGNIKPYFYLYSQNSFNVNNWFTFYLTGWYQSQKQDGIYLRKSQSTVNVGFEKSVLNNTLKLNLDFNDLFTEVGPAGNYTLGVTDIIFARRYNSDFTRISVSYNFGKLKKSKFRNKKVGESETNRAD